MNNNNLIIFLQNGEKHVISFSLNVDEQEALERYETMRPESKGKVRKYFFIKEDTVSPEVYRNHYQLDEDDKLTMDIRTAFIEKMYGEIRNRRDFFLTNLDVPFFRALEEEDQALKGHVIKLKSFLRDLPDNVRFNDIEQDADILRYNPFGNIFHIEMLEKGSGYTAPPKVTIDDPTGTYFGFAAKAVASIKDGEVERIDVVDYGCGYDFAPSVTIEAPESGEQAFAANGFPQNVVLSDRDIIANTELRYS